MGLDLCLDATSHPEPLTVSRRPADGQVPSQQGQSTRARVTSSSVSGVANPEL